MPMRLTMGHVIRQHISRQIVTPIAKRAPRPFDRLDVFRASCSEAHPRPSTKPRRPQPQTPVRTAVRRAGRPATMCKGPLTPTTVTCPAGPRESFRRFTGWWPIDAEETIEVQPRQLPQQRHDTAIHQ